MSFLDASGRRLIAISLLVALWLVLVSACIPEPSVSTGPVASPAATAAQTPTLTVSALPSATPATAQPSPTQGNLEVLFLDVGQGDSIVIQSPDGKTMLIDGGERSPGVVSYLNKASVKQIDIMVATHPHSDHIGGLVDVLQRFKVAEVWINGQPHTTKVFEDFLMAIDKSGAKYHEAKRGDVISLGSLQFKVLHPGPVLVQDINGNSIVLRLAYGDISFLFVGDANFASESEMLAAKQDVKSTILKVGHHGSATSSSATFLKAVAPQLAVYSAGIGNSYGHPAPATIARLNQAGAKVYGTDVSGTIGVTTDGKTYEVKTQR